MVVFTAYITKRDGTRIYARDYGKRCFVIYVDGTKKRQRKP